MKYSNLREWAIKNQTIFTSNNKHPYSPELKTNFQTIASGTEAIQGILNVNEMPHGLARVKNAVVDGTTGLILTENNDLLYPGLPSDGQTKGPRFIKEQNEAIEKISINTREAEIEDGVIACLGSKYFGHMIVYTVGIVNTLIDCPTKNIPFYFISPISKKFISEILDIAGIKTNQIRALNKRERVKFKNLWCPIMPVSYGLGTHHTSTDFFARFREATGIPQELPTLPSARKRVYIARGDASYRKVLNEKEIIKALEKYSFQTIEASKYSFSELHNILGNAEIIISALGSNMFNCIFAPAHAQVGEFVPDFYKCDPSNMNCVSTVVAGCGQDYWRINCDVIKEEGTKYSKWDFHVPIENVTACVDRMLRNLSSPTTK